MEKSIEERDLSPEEISSLINSIKGFSTSRYSHGILKDVEEKELKKWLTNPIRYKEELEKYAMYQYITQGDIFTLFNMVRILPSLSYNIKSLTPNKTNKGRLLSCKKILNEINHKELTRDILSQLVSSGTVVGLWVGKEETKSKESPYLMLFDNLEFFFPGRRKRGKWTVWCDLSYFTNCDNLDYSMDLLDNLSPYITIEDLDNFIKKGEEYRYIELPVERSICLRTHTLKRNQRFGIPWNTQTIYDIKHKQKLRNLEKVASNKVMNAVAVLTLGIDGGESTWKKLGKTLTKSTFDAVKKGLNENKEGDSSIVGLPEWGKLSYPDTHVGDVLDPEKITSVNDDINNDIGVSRGLTTGKDTTYAVAKLDLDILFSRIGELLEIIDSEVYNKLLNIILPNSARNNFTFEYEKVCSMSPKDKATILQGLASTGYSIKPLLELLNIDFDEFIEQSLFEIEDLDLRKKITPPLTSFTMNGEDTKDEGDNTNESTQNSRENNDGNSPRASK